MRKHLLVGVVGLFSVSSAPIALAEPSFAVGAKVGVQGLSLQVRSSVSDDVFARVNYSVLNGSGTIEGEDGQLSYDASIKSRAFGALVDWHPWGSFRFTAGLHSSDVKGEGTAQCDELLCESSSGNPVTALDTVTINYDTGDQTYLFGIGVTTNRNEVGFGFDAELGVLWRPDVNVELSSSSCLAGPCVARLEEEEKGYEDNLAFLPVLSVGVVYSF